MVTPSDSSAIAAEALEYLTLVPYLVTGLLLAKFLFAGVATASVVRHRAGTLSGVLGTVAGWTMLVLAVAIFMAVLIPDPRLTLVWCLAVTALVIPLGRVVVLPLAVAWNRHR